MKKLEDIPKTNIYQVPEGYFDRLPGVIQARVATPEPVRWFMPILKLAGPVAIILVAATVWFNVQTEKSIEDQLSSIQTEQLELYLENGDLPTELITESVEWSETDLMELEQEVYSNMEPIGLLTEDELSIEL